MDTAGALLVSPDDGTRVIEGKANGGAGAGAGGFGGSWAGVQYLAMLLCEDRGSPDWVAMRFMDVAELLPCMI